MNSATTNSLSVTIGSFRRRIYAKCLNVGTLFTKMHAGSTYYKGNQIYKCIKKIKDGPFTVIVAKPYSGRSQDIKFLSGERYVYIQKL